jgi:hypothetical protein
VAARAGPVADSARRARPSEAKSMRARNMGDSRKHDLTRAPAVTTCGLARRLVTSPDTIKCRHRERRFKNS